MTTTYATLCFPNYATAKSAAQALGFWDEEADQLRTDGQTIRPDGSAFAWCVDEIGEVPGESGYYVNATGELLEAVAPYIVPYGSGGRVFAGTEPEDG
jgi:hypothetical protein